MSRKDHRDYDAALQRLRDEAAQQRQNEARFKWQDTLTLVGFLLTIVGFMLENTIIVIGCFAISALLICLSIYSHREWSAWRYIISVLVVALFSGLSVRTYSNSVERELSRLHGRLLPSDEPTPTNACDNLGVSSGNGILVLMGFATSYVDQFPHTVVEVDQQPRLVVNRDSDQTVTISLDIFGADGKVIAELDKDGFTVREHSYFKFIRTDRSSLKIIDEYNTEVLNVRYVNPKALWINALLRYPGSNPVVLHGSAGGGICTAHGGTAEINIQTKKYDSRQP